MDPFYRWITHHPRWVLAAIGALALGAVLVLFDFRTLTPRLQIESEVEKLLPNDGEELVLYERFRERFGSDTILFVGMVTEDVFTAENLHRIRRMTHRFAQVDGIRQVVSLSNAPDIKSQDGSVSIESVFDEVPSDPAERRALRERVLDNPIHVGSLVSADGRTAAFLVYPREMSEREFRGRGIDHTIESIAREEAPDAEILIAGLPPLKAATSRILLQDLLKFIPLGYLFMAIVAFSAFRSVRGVAIPAGAITLGQIWTLAVMVLAGRSLNLVTFIVPPLINAVGFAYSVHMVSEHDDLLREGERGPEAVRSSSSQTKRRASSFDANALAIPGSVGGRGTGGDARQVAVEDAVERDQLAHDLVVHHAIDEPGRDRAKLAVALVGELAAASGEWRHRPGALALDAHGAVGDGRQLAVRLSPAHGVDARRGVGLPLLAQHDVAVGDEGGVDRDVGDGEAVAALEHPAHVAVRQVAVVAPLELQRLDHALDGLIRVPHEPVAQEVRAFLRACVERPARALVAVLDLPPDRVTGRPGALRLRGERGRKSEREQQDLQQQRARHGRLRGVLARLCHPAPFEGRGAPRGRSCACYVPLRSRAAARAEGSCPMRIAFLGLGVMGAPMAGHLAAAGHDVRVYNRTEERARRWCERHSGTRSDDPRSAVADVEAVLCCLGDDPDVRAVLCEGGALEAAPPGALVVDHTTGSAELARELHRLCTERGQQFVDAPVSGGQAGAEAGALTILLGGDEAGVARAQPLLEAYGRRITHMGPPGSGQLAKMVNQICIAGVLEGLAEGLHFALAAGLDPARVVDAISQGAAQSWQMENRWETMVAGEYEHGFAVQWMRKDLRIALAEARRNGASLPAAALVDQLYAEVEALGGKRWDTSSLMARLERLRGAHAGRGEE